MRNCWTYTVFFLNFYVSWLVWLSKKWHFYHFTKVCTKMSEKSLQFSTESLPHDFCSIVSRITYLRLTIECGLHTKCLSKFLAPLFSQKNLVNVLFKCEFLRLAHEGNFIRIGLQLIVWKKTPLIRAFFSCQ